MIINIRPIPKGRPCFSRGHAYTPKRTRIFEAEVKILLKRNEFREGRMFPTENKVILSIMFVYKRDADIDNFVKAFSDSANGVLFKDDRQVVKIDAGKRKYVKDKEVPHIEYSVEEA
jgi:Holliday junction resolvase RusA-like endonuclease